MEANINGPKPHYSLTFTAAFILLSIIRYYWPESGLTIFNVLALSVFFTGLAMLQNITDKFDN